MTREGETCGESVLGEVLPRLGGEELATEAAIAGSEREEKIGVGEGLTGDDPLKALKGLGDILGEESGDPGGDVHESAKCTASDSSAASFGDGSE